MKTLCKLDFTEGFLEILGIGLVVNIGYLLTICLTGSGPVTEVSIVSVNINVYVFLLKGLKCALLRSWSLELSM